MAGLQKKLINFGIDEVHVGALVEDSATARTYDNILGLLRLEGAQDLKITEVSSDYTLQGDNGTVDVRSITEGYEIELTYGAPTLEQAKLFKGATLVEQMDPVETTKVIKRTLTFKSTDQAGYLGLIGVVASSGIKVVLPKLKVISVEVPYSNLTHSVFTVKAKALKSDFDKVMQKMIQEDPAARTAPALTDFQ